ncbi:chemotaxis protein CheR [Aquibacillus halophilus]|uniref:protein-glutamate O-methyltransferase n=1 Tax=Aquibacillus halophilus TaxID=930132 RepID=A0A6A8DME0_9BACI|nr:protein-glutamate O-methyltransferase CheR [Aquibacillus halophilus]MRH42402.1 chemotaxis protein CheR [Aquibacillus halophilus]
MGDYQDFTLSVMKKTGIDLSMYKEVQMKRRLTSLREKRGFSSFDTYFNAVTTNKELFDEFIDRVTINVSEFYRNYNRWTILENKVLPMLLKKTKKIKIWSAACSTGEEPYTIAMILSKLVNLNSIDIIATDIDEKVLSYARKGVYAERALKEVPISMKKTFFTQDGVSYKIDDRIKNCVTFKKHNLLSDSYSNNFDLIVCRNVLIYFTEDAKHVIYNKFSKSLNPEGIFFVGSTEQIFSPERYGLRVYDTFFYQKK